MIYRDTELDVKNYNNNCLEVMKELDDESIDLILCDLPYGRTKNGWDVVLDKIFWRHYERILKSSGSVILTCIQPYTSRLIIDSEEMCNRLKFRYELIWEKTIGSGQLNIKHQPLRVHENILVFYKQRSIYNPQMSKGESYKITRDLSKYSERNYNEQNKKHTSVNSGFRHPKSIIKVSNPRVKGGHPTQKPVALMEYLIKTYSNEGEIVLDNCMGSGTTGVACVNTRRQFIGIELNKIYFDSAEKRIAEAIQKNITIHKEGK